MDIYLINLDRRQDRLADMHTRLSALGLTYTRIAAVDGTGNLEIGFSGKLPNMTKPEHACYLSHLKAYKAMLKSGAKHCLVLEDDVVMAKNFSTILKDLDLFTHLDSVIRLEVPFQCIEDKPVRLGRQNVHKTGLCRVHRLYTVRYIVRGLM